MSHENGSAPIPSGAEPVSSNAPPAPYTQPKKRLSPDQNCFGLLIGCGLLVATVLIWMFFYWWISPDFHAKVDPNAPRPIAR